MWVVLAVCSALGLGFYDVMKKLSVRDNNVPIVLWFNTLFGTLLLSPVIVGQLCGGSIGLGDSLYGHMQIMLKSLIVLSSWILGYFAIKHLPLTIQGPINASRPVIVLVGAMLIFGERLNLTQWIGILLGFVSLFFISRLGAKEGFSMKRSVWLWMSVGATCLGAVSALYDKYLMQFYRPLEVQAWYSLYQLLMMSVAVVVINKTASYRPQFHWRWTILGISLFLTGADLAYFYALSLPGAMISVISMIRRGSVLVSFCYGVIVLREKHVKAKLADLALLLLSLTLLIIGS
ncbi:MAG: DMT family transporter [Bacteroides sp.]|nr:DMT family transporter [Bacteroides sp.]MCM1378834.1 DMT family transporter [Bacteroides sp.]MCM1445451.1 DMT family transporter [Prevotella sp.]